MRHTAKPPITAAALMQQAGVVMSPRNTLWLGQTGIIPVLLVLLGCFAARGRRVGGVLIGVAAALQPALLLFAPLLWFAGRRRTAAATGVAFAGATVLARVAVPHDSHACVRPWLPPGPAASRRRRWRTVLRPDGTRPGAGGALALLGPGGAGAGPHAVTAVVSVR